MGCLWLPNNLQVVLLHSRGLPRGYLAAKGCPGLVVEFNNYSINFDGPMSLTSLLHGAPQFHQYIYIYDIQALYVL